MPTYEYRCNGCDTVFEKVLRLSDRTRKKPTCPSCKSEDVERVFSSFFANTSRKS